MREVRFRLVIYRSWFPLVAAGALLVIAAACRGGAGTGGDVTIPHFTATPAPQECLNAQYPVDAPQFGDDSQIEYKATESGLGIFDRRVGDGESPVGGNVVTVHYTGFLEDGCIFDSSRFIGESRDFLLDGLIPGMTEGVSTMRAGGDRRIRIPPGLAYGTRAIPGVIPANSTLVFEIELIDVFAPVEESATSTDSGG